MLTLNECVEKQSAKPVKVTKDEFMITYKCWRCQKGIAFRVGSQFIGEQKNYCCDCGQKLDWSVI